MHNAISENDHSDFYFAGKKKKRDLETQAKP